MKRKFMINVQINMKRNLVAFGLLTLTLIACGGGGTTGQGSVSGLVLDINGNPVRGARVFTAGTRIRETFSTNSGSYQLNGVTAEDILVQAEISQNGTFYRGENLARVFQSENLQSHNLVVARPQDLGSIRGFVVSSRGIRVQGARISVKPTSGNIVTSAQAIADDNGDYQINGLVAGKNYQVLASFPGFTSADAVRIPAAGTSLTQNFTLQASGNPSLPIPAGVSVLAWTSPGEVTRDRVQSNALDSVKHFIDKRYKKNSVTSRTTVNGNPVEFQLYWDRFDSLNVLGYGVERRRGQDAWQEIDFVRDPLAESYLDSDQILRENVNYGYRVFSGDVNYGPGNPTGSDYSSVVSTTALGDMQGIAVSTTGGQVRFSWNAVTNANVYTIYVFTEFPGINVTSYDNNFNNPAVGTSWVYNLKALQSGQRYYYLIMGSADYNSDNNDDARTLSSIGSFVAP
jgi:hypothetical protein